MRRRGGMRRRGVQVAGAAKPRDGRREGLVERATRIGREMLRAFGDGGGALRGHPGGADAPDAGAVPEEENILAARFLAALARVTGDGQWRERARGVLAVMALPAHAAARGRFVGDLLLALDECGLWPWDALSPGTFVRTEGHATLAARLDAGGLVVTVTPRDSLHVNTAFPAALSLEASGAAVPAALRRADAARVADEALVFRVGEVLRAAERASGERYPRWRTSSTPSAVRTAVAGHPHSR